MREFSAMIHFRCPACGKRYLVSEEKVGQRLTCPCQQKLRVPRQSGRSAKYRSPVDILVEFVSYGLGGALLGLLLGLLLVSRVWIVRGGWRVIAGLTVLGFLAGGLCGEAGVNWVGRMIRAREQK
jgi:hypothetical protein